MTAEEAVSDREEVSGTDPVRRTIRTPRVSSVIPRDLEKYSSSKVASRTSGESIAMMMVGDSINGTACKASHPAVPYVYE